MQIKIPLCLQWRAEPCLHMTTITLSTCQIDSHGAVARSLCLQRSGSFVMVSSTEEIQKLNSFLQSLNITQPVWIESAGMLQKTGEHHIPLFPACLIFATLSISFFSKHYRLFARSSRHIHASIYKCVRTINRLTSATSSLTWKRLRFALTSSLIPLAADFPQSSHMPFSRSLKNSNSKNKLPGTNRSTLNCWCMVQTPPT